MDKQQCPCETVVAADERSIYNKCFIVVMCWINASFCQIHLSLKTCKGFITYQKQVLCQGLGSWTCFMALGKAR